MPAFKINLAACFVLALGATAMASQPAVAQVAQTPAYSTSATTIGVLLENPATKAIIDKQIPGLSSNAQIGMASGMTLRAIQPMAGDMITAAMLDAVDADLAKLPAK